MNWLEMLQDAVSSSFFSMLQITLIVIPLLVVTEFLKEGGLLNKISRLFEPFTNKLNLSKEAAFPIVIAWTVGLQYGAGIVMQVGKEGNLTTKELTITGIFIGIAHSLIEETILFSGIGGNPFILFFSRFFAGLIFTYIFLLQLKLVKHYL
ncbi:nucleoside recognition domain-containing protein [Natranaerofaba carboxydovora]|uniref:nucleoside recognition domain-containing protein n=1 Tax=Natranaerofaba carboxydovora TaxID=2742683 RepID=UPI001F13384B|nr:nucleoside recognition domain-containing protein [Natranaerofaba carboxydovora]UMZ74666.1 spore_ylbJ: sporulation integral membrane protein YlbJ [Natranaerofaba carboxydovora]